MNHGKVSESAWWPGPPESCGSCLKEGSAGQEEIREVFIHLVLERAEWE